MNTKFNSKETYLAYRSEWKARYKELSENIRKLRFDIRNAQRHNEYAGYIQFHKPILRKQAKEMLEELKEAKQEAQRQYLASKKEMVMA